MVGPSPGTAAAPVGWPGESASTRRDDCVPPPGPPGWTRCW
jgi:hypothetical protein